MTRHVTLRLSDAEYATLTELARVHHRSIRGEAEFILMRQIEFEANALRLHVPPPSKHEQTNQLEPVRDHKPY